MPEGRARSCRIVVGDSGVRRHGGGDSTFRELEIFGVPGDSHSTAIMEALAIYSTTGVHCVLASTIAQCFPRNKQWASPNVGLKLPPLPPTPEGDYQDRDSWGLCPHSPRLTHKLGML
jgi:hypothetical protein